MSVCPFIFVCVIFFCVYDLTKNSWKNFQVKRLVPHKNISFASNESLLLLLLSYILFFHWNIFFFPVSSNCIHILVYFGNSQCTVISQNAMMCKYHFSLTKITRQRNRFDRKLERSKSMYVFAICSNFTG